MMMKRLSLEDPLPNLQSTKIRIELYYLEVRIIYSNFNMSIFTTVKLSALLFSQPSQRNKTLKMIFAKQSITLNLNIKFSLV